MVSFSCKKKKKEKKIIIIVAFSIFSLVYINHDYALQNYGAHQKHIYHFCSGIYYSSWQCINYSKYTWKKVKFLECSKTQHPNNNNNKMKKMSFRVT